MGRLLGAVVVDRLLCHLSLWVSRLGSVAVGQSPEGGLFAMIQENILRIRNTDT